uniref:DUF7041 domain-containing protein n=1 Tax=Lepeophtheirus salmonis TaxID=72036 RepID=A0A0K2UIE5_LEPSM
MPKLVTRTFNYQGWISTTKQPTVLYPSFFHTKQPSLLFGQAERQFRVKGIAEKETKYDYICLSLDDITASRVAPLIRNPPKDPYFTITGGLLDIY